MLSVCLSSFLITIVNSLCSATYGRNPAFLPDLRKFLLTFDAFSIRILLDNWEAPRKGGFLVPVCPSSDISAAPHNSFIIRSSERPLPQTLWNLHFPDPLRSAHSKGLTGARLSSQLLCHQYLRGPLASAHSKGLITSLESALTRISPVPPLECAVPKSRREGCYG